MSRLVQDGRIGQRLYNRFVVRDRIPLEVEPSIQPVCIVEDLREPSDAEAYVLRAACQVQTGTPAAGNIAQVCLFNPTGSGMLLKLVSSWGYFIGGTNDRCDGGWVFAELATAATTERFLNSSAARVGAALESKPVGRVSYQSGTAGPVGAQMIGMLTQSSSGGIGSPGGYPALKVDDPGILIDEGIGWSWFGNLVITPLMLTLVWDEIPKGKLGRQ